MRTMKKAAMLVIALSIIIAMFGGCGGQKEEPIVIGEGDWDSNVFHNRVAKIIIEEGFGYETDIIMSDTSVTIAGFKTNDMDFCLEIWSDNVPTYQEDLDNGDYVELSVNYDDNMQGLYVPTYLVEGPDAIAPDLKTVEDLKNYPELFPNPEEADMGIIYGGPEGWGATEFLHKKMIEYGLDQHFSFKTIDSSATLSATLVSAYKKGEPWVGYYWEPTWIMGVYDMTLLEDIPYTEEDYEQGIGAFTTVNVTVVGTQEAMDNYPEVAAFLKNYTTSSELTSAALGYMQENEVEAEEAAIWFLQENADLWQTWVPEDVFNKVMEAIK